VRGREDIPRIHILRGWENLLPSFHLALQEPLQLQKAVTENLVLELFQPALVQCLKLQSQQVLLLGRELLDPCLLVEFGYRCSRC
jgi:hypothetical protein